MRGSPPCEQDTRTARGTGGTRGERHNARCAKARKRPAGPSRTLPEVVPRSRNDCWLASCFRSSRLPVEGGSRGHTPLLAAHVQSSPPSPGTSQGHLHTTLSRHRAWGSWKASRRHVLPHSQACTHTHTRTHVTQTQALHPHVHTCVHKHTHTNHNRGQPSLADKLPPAQASARSWPGRRAPREHPGVRGLRPVSTVTSNTPRAHHVSVRAQASPWGRWAQLPAPSCFSRKPHGPLP